MAGGLGDDAIGGGGVEGPVDHAMQQFQRVGPIEAADHHRGDPVEGSEVGGALPCREEHEDPFGLDASGHEREDGQ